MIRFGQAVHPTRTTKPVEVVSSWKHVSIRRATIVLAACCTLGFVGVRVRAQDANANSANDILAHLNAAIGCYKNITTRISAGTEPSDSVYLNNAQNLPAQVVRLGFQSAQAYTDLLSDNTVSPPDTGQHRSEFSSLATFAGFVTAGIAVGLQTILLSVAAYFFVIGRYGISVGDRVSVAGVTGDVIDVGLFRFYVMEFAGTGYDLYPTGRIAVFSNAVLFQATTPLFKQLPGTRYMWHEAAIPLTPNGNYTVVQDALESAVMPVFKEYKLDSLWHRSAYE